MAVRAKFIVNHIAQTGIDAYEISLTPVVSGSDENAEFYKWTPGGIMKLQTVNRNAAEQFVFGAEYYVDFTKAE